MSNLRQAAQQALEALGLWATGRDMDAVALNDLIHRLEAALANGDKVAPTEPVAHLWQHSETGRTRVVMPDQVITADAAWFVVGPLYLAPPQRKPLTEEEIENAYKHIWRALPDDFEHTTYAWIEQGIRYAEQAHGIKDAGCDHCRHPLYAAIKCRQCGRVTE